MKQNVFLIAVILSISGSAFSVSDKGFKPIQYAEKVKGEVRIVYKDGTEFFVKDKNSCGTMMKESEETMRSYCDDFAVAPDKRTVGWLVYYPYDRFDDGKPNQYLAGVLQIYRDERVVYTLRMGQTIFDWRFLGDGDHVAIHSGPLHGSSGMGTLFDLSKSTITAEETFGFDSGSDAPAWAQGLN